MTPSACSDYLWDAARSEFVCQATPLQAWLPTILLAILLIVALSSFLVIVRSRNELGSLLDRVLLLVEHLQPATGVKIYQIRGDVMAINGVQVGGQGTFVVKPVPPNAQLPAGQTPQWSAGDPSIGLTPSSDGLSVVASVPAGSPLTSFSLTVVVGTFQSTVSVPVVAQLTGVEIDQTA